MLSEIYEMVKIDLKVIFCTVFTGIVIYYFSTWRDKALRLREQAEQFNKQIKATIAELKASQRGKKSDHHFNVNQLSKLLALDALAKYPDELEVLNNLKVDMKILNNGGRIQDYAPGDVRWSRTTQSIVILERML
jgi:hypothetical protein